MLVIPAIDLKGGRCVRLLQGDPDRETVYGTDPLAMARRFQDMGAKLLHVVDLDGAFDGKPVHFDTVVNISRSLSIPVETGGGIRSAEAVRLYVEAGVKRVILGTVLFQEGFLDSLGELKKYVVAGVDAKDSMVATHGWKQVSNIHAVDFIRHLRDKGIGEVIYTDISTDGMLSGPNIPALINILDNVPGIGLIASGGVSSLDDVKRLKSLEPRGLAGCITGKAVYDGRIDLAEAIRCAG